jgi:hypothetical protein
LNGGPLDGRISIPPDWEWEKVTGKSHQSEREEGEKILSLGGLTNVASRGRRSVGVNNGEKKRFLRFGTKQSVSCWLRKDAVEIGLQRIISQTGLGSYAMACVKKG